MEARAAFAVLWCVLTLTAADPQPEQQKQKQAADQIGVATVTSSGSDLAAAATHGHGGHGGEKFFMYAHQPDKKQYEFGFKRGNDHHTIERYEKGGPHHNFKAKVRWEDSKGGYGEHYWDYNHAPKYHDDHHDGHHGGHDDYHDDHHDDHHGGYHDDHHDDHHGGHGGYHDDHNDHGGYHSHPIPDFAPALASSSSQKVEDKREGRSHTPSDQHQRRSKVTSPRNKVGVEKDSGLEEKEKKKEVVPRKKENGRKKYGFFNERRSFEYSRTFDEDGVEPKEIGEKEVVESPSGFKQNPSGKFYPRSSPATSASSSYSSPLVSPSSRKVSESKKFSAKSPSSPRRAFNRRPFKRPRHRSSSSFSSSNRSFISTTTSSPIPLPSPPPQRKPEEPTTSSPSSAASSSSPPSVSPSGLAFDLETGRVYDEESGVWYSLVPLSEP